MSSRDIAELTGKLHKNVLRDIKSALIAVYGVEEVERTIPDHRRNRSSEYIRENADAILSAVCDNFGIGSNWSHTNEKPFTWKRDNRGLITVIYLDRSLTYTVIAGYDVAKRKKIIDRWMQLEAKEASSNPAPTTIPQVPKSFREALLLAAEQQEKIERQQHEIGIHERTLSRIEAAPDDLGIRDVGRKTQVGQDAIKDFLFRKGWACKQGSKIRPAKYGLDMGYVRLVGRFYTHRITGEERISDEFKITPKGVARISKLIAEGKFI